MINFNPFKKNSIFTLYEQIYNQIFCQKVSGKCAFKYKIPANAGIIVIRLI